MRFIVKNTTKYTLLDLVCPHSCRGCALLGSVLCERCKKNLFQTKTSICPLCKRVVENGGDSVIKMKCGDCELPFRAVAVGGWREGALDRLVKDYKYRAVRAAGDTLAELLSLRLPEAWFRDCKTVRVVPLPTIGKHVRQRGIDHTAVLARKLAQRRGWKVERLLVRAADTVQVGTKMAEREAQAERAYSLVGEVDKAVTYVLVDDIWTTGASMLAAAGLLREAGANDLMAAVLATGRAKEVDEPQNSPSD